MTRTWVPEYCYQCGARIIQRTVYCAACQWLDLRLGIIATSRLRQLNYRARVRRRLSHTRLCLPKWVDGIKATPLRFRT